MIRGYTIRRRSVIAVVCTAAIRWVFLVLVILDIGIINPIEAISDIDVELRLIQKIRLL